MSAGNEAPWAAAWREWVSLAGQGFKSASAGQPFAPQAASANGFAESYFAFARAIQQILKQGGRADFANRFIQSLQAAARQGANATNSDNFLNVFLRAMPSALLGAFPDANAGRAWQQWSATLEGWAAQWLALPAVGPQREWQESVQAVQGAVLAEQGARTIVDEHYRLATRAALERFARYLQNDDGAPITTLRALYDAWIDQAEAAYAERVMSDAFARDFAAWVNAGSDVRLAVRGLNGRLTAMFDAPQRAEIDALLERQQAMQRELAALRVERQAPREAVRTAVPVVEPQVEVSKLEAPASAANTSTRPARKRAVAKARPVKSIGEKSASQARPSAPKVRQQKPAGGEFDIAHILDAGK